MTVRTRASRTLSATVVLVAGISFVHGLNSHVRANTEWALQLTDFAALPITGSPDGAGNNAGSLARINFLREEPSTRRFFVNDLTGPLYILDRKTKHATKYLDFDGRGTRPGLFDKLAVENGLASGFISFQFDPDYARNGKFYTIHLEDLWADGSMTPSNTSAPGLALAGYTPSTPIRPPGEVDHEAVLIEWTDSNIANSTFEGTARELMRVQLNSRIHPMGDMIFNPAARRGDPDWRVLYISCGDGGAGDQRTSSIRLNGQRLDTMIGKILRIVPDLTEHVDSSTVSENGRYRVPRDNPFTSIEGARKEIWAYGLRNPHRMSWDVDPSSPANNHLIATVIGWRTWEMTVIIHKGANYGFPLREGNQLFLADGTFGKPTDPDTIPVQVTDTITHGTVKPTYPVLQYGHTQAGGDAIAGGFVYRGKAVPNLRGKYVFGDISTGRLWYADYSEMLAADDGDPGTLAQIHELGVQWDDPTDAPDRGKQFYPTMFPIVRAAYHSRGGQHADLPGTAALAPSGRVDVRLAVDGGGEFYVLTKSDGMIRLVTGLVHASATH
jgi:Glucose / Sorbosone dehydrogenase